MQEYYDPRTGETILLMDEEEEYRNAGRDHRGGGGGGGVRTLYPRPPRQEHTRPPVQSGIPPRSHGGSEIVRHHPSVPQYPQHADGMAYRSAEYVSIRKAALAELIPAFGQIWASTLGRPDMPKAIGDPVIDQDNAAMHRDALALHQQNQTRILALTDLAARAVRLLVA